MITLTEQTPLAASSEPLFPEYVPTPEQEALKKLRTLAQDLDKAMDKTVEKYITLCEHIRVSQFMPKTIAAELTPLGFPPSRISEIQRVALVSDEVWSQYKSRAIGFRVALQMAREERAEEATRKAAAEAARNPELPLGEKPAEATEPAQESKPKSKSAKAAAKADAEPEIWGKWEKEVSPKSARIEKTKTAEPMRRVKTAGERLKEYLQDNLFATSEGAFLSGITPQMIFDIDGWKVEVRITRAKQTKKPAKKPATKTNKNKGKK